MLAVLTREVGPVTVIAPHEAIVPVEWHSADTPVLALREKFKIAPSSPTLFLQSNFQILALKGILEIKKFIPSFYR